MSTADALLPEFDREMTLTRALLARVPDARLSWKPHDKSMSLGALATHLATLPFWGTATLTRTSIDTSSQPPTAPVTSRDELLARFDGHVAAARAALAGSTDADLMATWSLTHAGHTLFTMPRTSVWRSFVVNHLIHHRGQLTVYLRLNDVPLPAMYGPSADEAPGF